MLLDSLFPKLQGISVFCFHFSFFILSVENRYMSLILSISNSGCVFTACLVSLCCSLILGQMQKLMYLGWTVCYGNIL